MGFIFSDEMKKNIDPTVEKTSDLTQFRDEILKKKMFSENVSDSLKTQLATYMISFIPRNFDNK